MIKWTSVLLVVGCLAAHGQSTPTTGNLLFKSLTPIGKMQTRPASSISSSLLWIGGETLDRDYARYDAYKSYVGPLGAKKIRLQSGWAKTEKARGQYNFAWLDSVVNNAISQGVQPWIETSYGNPIYEGAGGIGLGEGLISSEEGFAAWENYVTALVHHFGDRVQQWEIWNEADLQIGGKYQGDYYQLFVRTATAVRKVKPDAFIVGLALADAGNIKLAQDFLQRLKDHKQLGLLDAITIHGYPYNPDESLGSLLKMREMIASYSPNIQLWQGETGCPSTKGSSGALNKHAWTEFTQAKWNSRRALMHIGHNIPFSLFTISEYSYASTVQHGLNTKGILKTNKDLSIAYAKQAYYAYQHLTAVFDSSLHPVNYEITRTHDSMQYTIATFRNDATGEVMKAVWLSGNIPSDQNNFQPLTLNFEKTRLRHPVYADVLNGQVYSVKKSAVSKTKHGMQITIPVYDSPVLIAERSLIKTTD